MIDLKVTTKEYKKLLEIQGESNVNALPKISKVTVNVGVGPYRGKQDMIDFIKKSLTNVTGQKPIETHARKSIAGFKVRENDLVGFKVTLRNRLMFDFLNRLINISLPRIRDFKGINPKSIDATGNISIGFKDMIPFVELGHDAIDKPFGMEVVISVKNSNKEKSVTYLSSIGFPMQTG